MLLIHLRSTSRLRLFILEFQLLFTQTILPFFPDARVNSVFRRAEVIDSVWRDQLIEVFRRDLLSVLWLKLFLDQGIGNWHWLGGRWAVHYNPWLCVAFDCRFVGVLREHLRLITLEWQHLIQALPLLSALIMTYVPGLIPFFPTHYPKWRLPTSFRHILILYIQPDRSLLFL